MGGEHASEWDERTRRDVELVVIVRGPSDAPRGPRYWIDIEGAEPGTYVRSFPGETRLDALRLASAWCAADALRKGV